MEIEAGGSVVEKRKFRTELSTVCVASVTHWYYIPSIWYRMQRVNINPITFPFFYDQVGIIVAICLDSWCLYIVAFRFLRISASIFGIYTKKVIKKLRIFWDVLPCS
jgi:hypothetical protein